MNYYILEFACATKETGPEYPQVQIMSKGYNYDAEDSVSNLSRCGLKLPSFTPNLDAFILHPKAHPTDLLSCSTTGSFGFLISEKLRKIFEEFKLPTHKYYQAKVKHKSKIYENYYWLHIVPDISDFVDYKRSVFFKYQIHSSSNFGYIKISSKDDYFNKREEVKRENSTLVIWAETIQLLPINLDLFGVTYFSGEYYINEKLREKIIKERVTGIKMTLANNIEIEK